MTKIYKLLSLVEDFKSDVEALDKANQQFHDLTGLYMGTFRAVYNDNAEIEIRYDDIKGPKIATATRDKDNNVKVNVDLEELFKFLLSKHDYTYMYADGHSYRKGSDSMATIKRVAAKLGLDKAEKLWNEAVDKHIRKDSAKEYYWKNIK